MAINERLRDFHHVFARVIGKIILYLKAGLMSGCLTGKCREINGKITVIREIVIYHRASASAIIVEQSQCVDARRCVVVLWSLK